MCDEEDNTRQIASNGGSYVVLEHEDGEVEVLCDVSSLAMPHQVQ